MFSDCDDIEPLFSEVNEPTIAQIQAEINKPREKEKVKCPICEKLCTEYSLSNHIDNHATKILDFLYLGDQWNAGDEFEILTLKISAVLNVAYELNNKYIEIFNTVNGNYKHVLMKDESDFDILNVLDDAVEYIENIRKKDGRVLVHCAMGISRSSSVVIGYLIKYQKMSFDEAYRFVKEKRSIVRPNDGFCHQLKKYEKLVG